MRIILLGPPGAGKGTQSELLSASFRIPHLSTGEILRSAIQEGTDLGKKAKAAVDGGELVSDDIVNGCVEERLSARDAQEGFVLDGYPRTIRQAETLDLILSRAGKHIDTVVELKVALEHLQLRIAARAREAIERGQVQRTDDNEETLRARIAGYVASTAPLSEYYRDRGKLVEIDGLADVEVVAASIRSAITHAVARISRIEVEQ